MYFKQEQKLSFEVVVLEYRLWCLINGKTILNASGLLIFYLFTQPIAYKSSMWL